MGSQSDYKVMKDCEKILKELKVKFETKIVFSAHRTPKRDFMSLHRLLIENTLLLW